MKFIISALMSLLLMACFDNGTPMRSNSKDHTVNTGKRFAESLINGKYDEAQSLLSKELQREYSISRIENQYKQMISYGHGKAEIQPEIMFNDNWPARRSQDIGWVYIPIAGSDYVEAVTVVVSDENGTPKISSIEWGRP